MWWGTLGFMVIEGWTTALLIASYLYLRQNYDAWPPLRTPYPSLLIPTINLAVMLLSCVPAWLAARAAKRLDAAAARRWLVVMSVAVLPTIVLRWWELWALNTRWDTNAYGSAAWVIVGFHASLLALDIADTLGLTLFFYIRKMPVKSLSDTSDNSMYWYFTVGIWIPIYLIVYVGPRIF
jgi:cytochrome c oxidase subunit I+III